MPAVHMRYLHPDSLVVRVLIDCLLPIDESRNSRRASSLERDQCQAFPRVQWSISAWGDHKHWRSQNGDIQYQNVSFSYPTRKDLEVLKDIDLHIKEGSKVALVGQSGSGKSTIVQLLMRFYDLNGGNILVNGKTIDSYEISNYRRNIGIVPQEVMLFGGTIKENILYQMVITVAHTIYIHVLVVSARGMRIRA